MLGSVRLQILFAFTLFSAQNSLGATLFQGVDELPSGVEYDFIVAGGGTGGVVVASRLGQDPKFKVLIIEAGPSNKEVFATRPPGLYHNLTKTHVDWNYTTTEMPGLNGRSVRYTRARMVGGCSSHNGMVYTRGSRDDWDQWAKITGEQAMSWDNMLPFMFKAEKLTIDSEQQSEKGHIDPSVHGNDGKVFVTAPYSDHPFNDLLLQTTQEVKEFPFCPDMNNGSPIGIAWNEFTIDHNAERSSAATAYLEKTGNNVHVLTNTYVTRLFGAGGGTDFRGVEFATDTQSERKKLVAKKEVIIAGGIIGTPQILMNSGIGSRDELEVLGVETFVDNPSVGKNLTDQVSSLVTFVTTLPDTDYNFDAALAEWNSTRTGPLVLPDHLNHIVYVRFPDDAAPFSQFGFPDPSGGANSPHVEFVFSQISARPPATVVDVPAPPPGTPANVTIQFLAVNLHPLSRGSVTLNSSDPFEYPNVDFGVFSHPLDIIMLREAIRSARRLYSSPAFSNSVFGTLLPAANVTSDDHLDAYIRSVTAMFLHGVGSAAMSSPDASWGVVDPDFRVKGTNGLRIVDASVFPFVPSGHTQVPVYAIAERASTLIAQKWR